jgi:hypothetical protein
MMFRMIRPIAACVALCITLTSSIALADAKDDAIAAVRKLAESDNYSWTTSAVGSGGAGATAAGKTQKDGLIILNFGAPGATQKTMVIFQGEHGVFQNPDGAWHTIGDSADSADQDAQVIARMVKTYQAPAVQASEIAAKLLDAKADTDGAISGSLSADDAKALLERRLMRRNAAGGLTDSKADVKFGINNGVATKIELHMQCSMIADNGQQRKFDRTTTISISDVNATKLDVPAEAKAKMKS